MNEGYIKLFRKLTEWEWYDDIPTFRLFTHLLLTANWKPTRWHGIEVKRGQRIVTIRGLAEETGLTERQIRTAMQHLKATHEVTQSATHKCTIITVENYSKYQGDANPSDTVNDTQSDTQPTQDKEYKNIRIKENTPTVYKRKSADEGTIHMVVSEYNSECPSLPKVTALSEKRKSHIRARLKQHSFEEISLAFRKAEASDFLTGRTKRSDWKANFDWLMGSETNLIKVLEDNYENRNSVIDKAVTDLQRLQQGLTQAEIDEQRRLFG